MPAPRSKSAKPVRSAPPAPKKAGAKPASGAKAAGRTTFPTRPATPVKKGKPGAKQAKSAKAATPAKPAKPASKVKPEKSPSAARPEKAGPDKGRFSRMASGPKKAAREGAGAAGAVTVSQDAAAPARAGSGSTGSPGGPRFSVHPSVEMMVQWAGELKPKTGRSLDEWVALVKTECPGSARERVEFLQKQHGMGTNAAWWIAERAEGRGAEDLDPDLYLQAAERYIDEQLAGKKSVLKPLFERLLALCGELGSEVRICPCRTIVPVYRNHVVAQLKVASNARIDLGLALGDTRAGGRLIDTGGLAKRDRITHRVEIKSESDVDAQLKGWLREAFARDA